VRERGGVENEWRASVAFAGVFAVLHDAAAGGPMERREGGEDENERRSCFASRCSTGTLYRERRREEGREEGRDWTFDRETFVVSHARMEGKEGVSEVRAHWRLRECRKE
jgi:hypothetical protein